MKKSLKYLLPLLFGSLLIPVPLLGDFHFESALIAATLGCFWGGIASSRLILKSDYLLTLKVLLGVYLFGLPLLLFSFFTDCLSWDGVGFWILVPFPSVFFGVSIGRFYRKLTAPFPTFLSIFTLLFISVGILIIEFLTLPQVYFFNHVWGAWPGPIYDETVRVTGSLFYFRGMTALWILILWFAPDWKKSLQTKLIVLSSIIILILAYSMMSKFRVITPRSTLQNELKEYQTEHFDIYYSEDFFTAQEIEYWALKHEFHFDQIVTQLEVEYPQERKIESYLYSSAWEKKELVGAKFTSYVPIWLEQDQLHIAKEHLNAVLKHELVHVISKQFGNSLFNGSWSIGLVEGLAEGIAKDASSESTLDQILSAAPPYPSTEQMKNSLSTSGFYFSAGSISYTTAGSFVSYLLEEYPVSNFKEAYPSSNFEEAYQVTFDSLVTGWRRSLPDMKIDSVDQQVSEFIFSQRSIFQKSCPHMVTPIMELWDQVRLYETNNRREKAFPIVNSLYEMAPNNLTIKEKWVQYQLRFNKYDEVINAIDSTDSIPTFSILKADAFALNNDWEKAYNQLEITWNLLPDNISRSFKYSFEMRKDTLNWSVFNSIRYQEVLSPPDSLVVNLPNQLLSIQKAIEINKLDLLKEYSKQIYSFQKNEDWFDIYELFIDRIIYLNEFTLAQNWINSISELELRPRYQERLMEQKEWLDFMIRLES